MFICGDVDQQLRAINYNSNNPALSKDEVLALKIKQLSMSKMMVNIHRKPLFLLVTAHSQLGEAYINNKIYELALEHLTMALKINGELLLKVPEAKDYHTHLLIMLGRCYFEAGSPKEALSLLIKSLDMNLQVHEQNHLSIVPILQMMAKVHLKLKDTESALNLLN